MTKYIINSVVVALFLASCSKYPADVELALRLADDNRVELESVLEHYRNDKLKYKAALYLIGNMPNKYSQDTIPTESYDSLFAHWHRINLEKAVINGCLQVACWVNNGSVQAAQWPFIFDKNGVVHLV